jgi:hypothetical protein
VRAVATVATVAVADTDVDTNSNESQIDILVHEQATLTNENVEFFNMSPTHNNTNDSPPPVAEYLWILEWLFATLVALVTIIGVFCHMGAMVCLLGSSRRSGTTKPNLVWLLLIVPMDVVVGGVVGVSQKLQQEEPQQQSMHGHEDRKNQRSVGMQQYTCGNVDGMNQPFLGSSCLDGMVVSGKNCCRFFFLLILTYFRHISLIFFLNS